jgi:hypothetical protein
MWSDRNRSIFPIDLPRPAVLRWSAAPATTAADTVATATRRGPEHVLSTGAGTRREIEFTPSPPGFEAPDGDTVTTASDRMIRPMVS